MWFARLLLIGAVLLVGLCGLLALLKAGPCLIVGLLILGAGVIAKKKPGNFWAYGTSRWATADDLKKAGYLNAKQGMILGTIEDTPPKFGLAVLGLFNPRINSQEACERFMASMHVRGF